MNQPRAVEQSRKTLYNVEQLAPDREDFVGVAIVGLAELRRCEVAAHAHEQLVTERFLEHPDLASDRGLGQAQLVGSRCHAAGSRDRPKVQQMVIVQPFHESETGIEFSDANG